MEKQSWDYQEAYGVSTAILEERYRDAEQLCGEQPGFQGRNLKELSYPEAADQEASDGNVEKTEKLTLKNGSLDFVDKYAGQVDEAVFPTHSRGGVLVDVVAFQKCARGFISQAFNVYQGSLR